MNILFDSRRSQFKEPFGCIEENGFLSLALYVRDAGETGVLFLLERDGEAVEAYPMVRAGTRDGYRIYSRSMEIAEPGLYFYSFQLTGIAGNREILRDEWNRPCCGEGTKWQLTCFKRSYRPPESFYGQVFYQIFPDRFNRAGQCDLSDKLTPFYLHENLSETPAFQPDANGEILNNDFFGGNLAGIAEKLPYLHRLGVRVLYLNPIFMAFSNHRYDTADYMRVDPMLGTNEDFKALCDAAHALGMRVLLDGVFSHTGSDSRYFDIKNRFGGGAYHDPASPYRGWYQFQSYPETYTSWWGIQTLPCVDEENTEFKQFVLSSDDSVVPYWLRQGADGWRLDVVDELPGGFLSELYATVKAAKPESLVLGEVWEDASNKISYGERRKYLQGGSLDSVMNYVWRDAVIRFVRGELSGGAFGETVMSLCEHYPAGALHTMMNLLSTHDTPRILTALAAGAPPEQREERAYSRLEGENLVQAKNRLFAAVFLMFTLPGCPCIYYGDEIGMQGFEDPFNRGYMGDRAGDEELLDCYGALAAMRNESTALQKGRLEPAFFDEGLYAFYRIWKTERILCVVNVSVVPKALYLSNSRTIYEKNTWTKENERLLLPYGSVAIRLNRERS